MGRRSSFVSRLEERQSSGCFHAAGLHLLPAGLADRTGIEVMKTSGFQFTVQGST